MEYKIGEHRYCPECGSKRAIIVWISKDGKTIAVQCPTSGSKHKPRAVILIDTSPRRGSYDLQPDAVSKNM